jgi:predicted alpha/beta-hydrolase family hydrolase
MEIQTTFGAALAEMDEPADPAFLLVLTHGAGGGVDSGDLLAARQAGLELGAAVARVVQPYRVRGARAPDRRRRWPCWPSGLGFDRERRGPCSA